MTVILFLIILAVLIFVHELGHFLTAKLFKIRVDEFAIGFPPKIFSIKRGETQYSLNLIPIGGYVKIFGENPNDDSMNGPDSARSFVNAKKWKQLIVLFAGIFMNLVFAWILISISFNIGLTTGVEDQYANKAQNVSVMVLSVLPNSPSDLAGLKEGDKITEIRIQDSGFRIINIEQVQNLITNSSGEINIIYERGNATKTAEVIPKSGIVDGKKAIGIAMGLVGIVKFGFFQSFVEGGKLMVLETKAIAIGLFEFIIGVFKGQSGILDGVVGPVGIVGMVGEASSIGISYLLGFIAMISINLAVLNAVPFPALDGGRALFVVIETIFRRKIKPAIANWANIIGFGLLILLMIFITYKDILRLVK